MSGDDAPGVIVEEVSLGRAPIEGVETSTAGFVGVASRGPTEAVRVRSFADFERAFGGLEAGSDLGYGVLQFFAEGGNDAWIAGVSAGTSLADGLPLLDASGTLGLLCLPGEANPDVLRSALEYAELRRAFVVVDPPDAEPTSAGDLRTSLGETGRHGGAVFFPPVLVGDPLAGGTPRTCPPSGSVAGMYARLDRARGVWKAPAGVDALLTGVVSVAVELPERDLSELSSAGVNCIRRVPGDGVVVWGARTIAPAGSDWKYVNVRRLFVYIEASIDRGTQWAVFEPNDEPLWRQLRLQCGLFLDGLFRSGAFPARTPDEAYFVRCGRDTMTEDDIENGRLNVVVGVAPLRPAEFVIIEIARSLERATDSWSASGRPSERLRLAHGPVHPEGVLVEVRATEGWIAWTQIEDLATAGPEDRVYVLDRGHGELVFGDGQHGARLPTGRDNVRARYRYGAGSVSTTYRA
jgi:phage tail sheath protein FI